jgi:hypothetical protein
MFFFSDCVVLFRGTCAVGAYQERTAFLFSRNVFGSTDWQQVSKIYGTESSSSFGQSVALSGSTMEFVIGGQWKHPHALHFDFAASGARCTFAVCPFACGAACKERH